jgi:SNF2 family DNA or RNA helicase
MDLLKELLLETIDSGHKVLLFSQFTSLLAIVRSWLDSEGILYEYLDGSTKDRMERVDSFNQHPEIPLFLLSLKAGGLGLNLTSADTVILYDPWWNPAAEAQAADRTHRIGQTRNVNIIKLLVKDSVEEKVLELQRRKADLFNDLVEASAESAASMSLEDFEFLLRD